MLLKIWVTSQALRLLRKNTASVFTLYILAMHKLHTIIHVLVKPPLDLDFLNYAL